VVPVLSGFTAGGGRGRTLHFGGSMASKAGNLVRLSRFSSEGEKKPPKKERHESNVVELREFDLSWTERGTRYRGLVACGQ